MIRTGASPTSASGDLSRSFVSFGQLDANGRATASWQLAPLPDGGLPGIQALVFPGSEHTRNTTSAAYYFVAPE